MKSSGIHLRQGYGGQVERELKTENR